MAAHPPLASTQPPDRSGQHGLSRVEAPQVRRQLGHGPVAAPRVLLHGLEADHRQILGDGGVEPLRIPRLLEEDLAQDLAGGAREKGALQGEGLVQGRAQRVHVGALVDPTAPSGRLLGRHVEGSADHVPAPRQGHGVLQARQPEVAHLGPSVFGQQDVGGLHVAVDDVAGVRVLQGVGNLGDQQGGRPEVPARQAALPLALPDVLGQRATAADQLLGDVVGPVLLAHGEDRDDAGVGLPAAGLGLAAELLHRPLGEAQVGSQHLQGHPPAKGSLLRLVHGGCRARADLPEDAELAQGGGGHAGLVAVARPVIQPPEEALELLREGRVLRQRVRVASGPARGGGLAPRALLALGPTVLLLAHGASSSRPVRWSGALARPRTKLETATIVPPPRARARADENGAPWSTTEPHLSQS